MPYRLFLLGAVVLAAAADLTAQDSGQSGQNNAAAEKIRALMICGGCCHDYPNQKRIIAESLNQRVGSIDWTILEYSSKREVKADIYKQADWIEGFDIVIHNECFGAIDDGEFVAGIVAGHVKHRVPAIVIHCSMHSYRAAPTADQWRALLGVTSRRHEKKKHSLLVQPTAAGKDHPILAQTKGPWKTPNGELYIIEKVWPNTTVLAQVHSDETNKDEPVIWTNRYKGVKVFGISLGHHNETMESHQWQDIVAAGWKWSLQP